MKHAFTWDIPQYVGQHNYLLFRISDMEDVQLRRSQRDRKLTEKGAEFTLVTKFKNRERWYKILSTLSDNLHKLLLSENDKEIVKSAYSEWLHRYEKFLLSHDEVQAWLSQSDQISDEENFRKRHNNAFSILVIRSFPC